MPAARVSTLLAAAFAVEFALELAFLVPADAPHRGWAALMLAAMAGGLALGPRAPVAGIVAVVGGLAVIGGLSPVYYDELGLPYGAPFVAAYWLGAHAGRRGLALGLALGGVLGVASIVPQDDPEATLAGALFTVAAMLGIPAVGGRLLRSRAALNRALREKAAVLERRRADAAGRAVADERARIAGELHDVVAHALSAMTVQSSGARRLALTRPPQARAAFDAIETTGREALGELRRLLGVLRRGDDELALAPHPSLRHVHSLARRTTAGGLPVTVRVEGDERVLPAGIDLTAYRVVQDALEAAREPGGAGRAAVRLRFGADTLELLVRDDGPSTEARPLIGTRERVVLHGGTLTAGPPRGGGHVVRATLPLDGRTLAGDEAPRPERRVVARRESALRRPFVVDGLVAAVVAVAAVVDVLVAGGGPGGVALALALALPLAWRRRAPLAVAAAVMSATLALALTFPAENLVVPFPLTLAVAFACAVHGNRREALAGLVLIAGAMPAIVATMEGQVVGDFIFPPLIVTVVWLGGRAVLARTRLAEQLHEAAARVAEVSEEERVAAAVDERRGIARELHDLVAHSMSVMVVQAGGARRILDRDPARALEAANRIERTGREALAEMRHLLGMLNLPEAQPALAPQPTLAEAEELVARARAAGLPTVLELRGERRPLPAGLDLAAYRIVQEALTNAIKHAAGAATTVTIEWHDDGLTLDVRNDGAPPTAAAPVGGHGLVGMRERVRIYGGALIAGPVETGGWRVRATFPLAARELALA
jgi:signal transduction histidine kinase